MINHGKTGSGIMSMTNKEIYVQLIANIMDRVVDLKSCNKDDNCLELAFRIQSYIPEWIDFLLIGEKDEAI